MKKIINNIRIASIAILTVMVLSCDGDEVCTYVGDDDPDCPNLQANIGDACDSNGDTMLDGVVNEFCECIGDSQPVAACPGLMQNGNFESLVAGGDPNDELDNDIDVASSWGPLWGTGDGSLADLFDTNTTNFGSGTFVAPTPPNGVFAGMWIEDSNNSSPAFREGMFNELSAPLLPNTGGYRVNFDYAVMSTDMSNDVKIGVYGVNFNGTLPPNPTSMQTPSNLDLYGPGNSVFLGEITVPSGTGNTYQSVSVTFNSNTLTMPSGGFTHIMITNSHLPLPSFGRMFIAFDEYCLERVQII